MITVATVCGMGLGTSMMLAMQVRELLKKEGIEAQVNPVDLGSFKSQGADIVVAPAGMKDQVKGTGAQVALIDNLINKEHVKERVMAAVEALNTSS